MRSRASRPRPRSTAPTAQVAVTLRADPQRRVYVRRINVAGNTRTRDEVVRREFRQFESSWYDGQQIKLSRDRVDRLGYFKDVSVDTNEVPGSPDQVDLTVNVDEKPTGNLLARRRLLQQPRSCRSTGVDQAGQRVRLGQLPRRRGQHQQVQRARWCSARSIPYFTIDGISRAIDVYYRTSQAAEQPGRGVPAGHAGRSRCASACRSPSSTPCSSASAPSAPRSRARTRCRNAYFIYRDLFGADQQRVSAHDRLGARPARQRARADRRAATQRVNLEWSACRRRALLRARTSRSSSTSRSTRRFTLGLNAEFGFGKGLGDRPFPIFKNFYGGGLGSVRGFDQGSLGVGRPHRRLHRRRQAPQHQRRAVPARSGHRQRQDAAHLRLHGCGQRLERGRERCAAATLRASAGIGLSWISPVGPLKLSWGKPLRSKPTDRIQEFQFQIGTAF